MSITFVSFDEIPSFKGASAHVLAGLRVPINRYPVKLISLGHTPLRPRKNFVHLPLNISERNLLRRGLHFRERVAGILRRSPPGLVHFRSPWEGLAAVRAGVPAIYEVNGLPSVELRYHHRVSESSVRIFRAWEDECLRGSRAIICPSPQIADYLEREFAGLSREKIRVLRNGFDPLPVPEVAPRTGGPFRFVYLGTLSEWQGVTWSLRAFRELSGEWLLDIYAPPAKESGRRLERLIRRYRLADRIRIHEPLNRAQLFHTLPKYDAALAPFLRTRRNTEQGCYPLKLLEYLAHGLPVIASDLPLVRSLIVDGMNGFLFPPNDGSSLRAVLASVMTGFPATPMMRRACRDSLRGHPTWDDYGRELSEIYARLL